MISSYPKDFRENLAWRRKILLRAKEDLTYREKVHELFHRDILFAFNAFFYTLDVRRRPFHHQPFCTYPFQDKAILQITESIRNGEDLAIEKSRDMGVSWMVILCFLHEWLNPSGGADFLLGSRIEDYVDKKGDMRTLLEKARYAFYRLPLWLRPDGFKKNTHDNFMKLVNPETGSSITGESNNQNFSTGGRYAAILFDEFAKWESTDKSAWTAAGDATPCRIPVSTAFGAAGQFYEVIHNGRTKKLTLHWSLHPRKAEGLYCPYPRQEDTLGLEDVVRSPWYDAECQRRSPLEVAQELDINYIGAGNPVFDGKAGKRVAQLLRQVTPPFRVFKPLLASSAVSEVAVPRDFEGFVVQWREHKPGDFFTIGVDVAEGLLDGDYSTIKVLNRRTKCVDYSYYSRIDEIQLARVLLSVVRLIQTKSWVGIETNGPGLATFDIFSMLGSDESDIFMMPRYDSLNQKVSFRKGWKTDATSKNILISGIRSWLLACEGVVDVRCAREMTTFIRDKNGRANAKAGTNDDEVIALGIALQVDELAPREEEEKLSSRRPDGLPDAVFTLEGLEREEPSLEERCFLQAKSKQLEQALLRQASESDLYLSAF